MRFKTALVKVAVSAGICGTIVLASRCLAVGTGEQASLQDYVVGNWKLQVTLVPEKASFMLGEPVYLSFTIRNNSSEDLAVIVGGDTFNWLYRPERFTVRAVRDDGVQVPAVEMPLPGSPAGNRLVVPQRIPANGSYRFSLFVSDWVEFKAPGRYTFTAARTLDIGRLDDSGLTSANVAHVDVRAEAGVSVVPFDRAALGDVVAARRSALLGDDEEAALAAAKALAAIDDERAAEPFIVASARSGYSVKFAAVSALARFTAEAALAALQRAATDPNTDIQAVATHALALRTARLAADKFLREDAARSDYEPIFLRADERGDEIWVVYRKVFPKNDRIENPANVRVAYNKASGTTRWMPY